MTSEDKKPDADEACDILFKEEPGVTDFALIVEGKKIFVSKALLCIVSPVFKAMFESEFKEKHCSEVELPGKSFKDVVDFMALIYPNIYKPLDFQTVVTVLPLLHEYGCQSQIDECRRFLVQRINHVNTDVDIDILLQCMYLSDVYNLQDVLDNCIEQGARHSSSLLTESDFFKKVPLHVEKELYYKRLVMLEKSGKDVVTDIFRQCSTCQERPVHKIMGLLLDTTIENHHGEEFEFKTKSKQEIITSRIE